MNRLVEQMRANLAANGYRFSALVETIVTSPQFLNKRGQDDSGRKDDMTHEPIAKQSTPQLPILPPDASPRRGRGHGPAVAGIDPGLGRDARRRGATA